jgi:hypothetical protein
MDSRAVLANQTGISYKPTFDKKWILKSIRDKRPSQNNEN